MTGLALTDVLDACDGELRGEIPPETVFPRVEPNPGSVRRGDLFLAVPGERLDGHEFAVVAAVRGAAAAIVARSWADRLEELPLPLVVVEEPLAALQRVASAQRARLHATVVAITGSVGKTSTKELVAAVLARRFTTYRSPGNRNNELGLPLSVLEIGPDVEVAVLEIGGGYAAGEVELLARIARPSIAVVTNVRPVHIARMGSIDAIAATKAELVDAVPPGGVAVLNGDDPRVREMARRSRGSVLMFGRGDANEVRADEVSSQGLDGSRFRLTVGSEEQRLAVRFPGRHAIELALAATAVGHALGLSLREVAPALEDPGIELGPRRVSGPNGSMLLDDTHNASTPSVLSALGILEESRCERRIAVLGDMLELGALADEEHRAVGRRAAASVDLLLTYGDLARLIGEEAARGTATAVSFGRGEWEGLISLLRSELRQGDLVLFKGSNALRMWELVEALAT